jgi:hypothetical protein
MKYTLLRTQHWRRVSDVFFLHSRGTQVELRWFMQSFCWIRKLRACGLLFVPLEVITLFSRHVSSKYIVNRFANLN